MADQTPATPEDLKEVIITARPQIRYFDIDKILGSNFLKSCRFAFFLPSLPYCIRRYYNISPKVLENMRFLCDSVEFPGKNFETIEYKLAGKNRAKVPYLRRVSEINLSFYHETEFPMYDLFSEWIELAAPRDTQNQYYEDIIVPYLNLIQFDSIDPTFKLELAGSNKGNADRSGGSFSDIFKRAFNRDKNDTAKAAKETIVEKKHFVAQCINVMPLSFASLPGNWADEGYHKINVSFGMEQFIVLPEDSRSTIFNLVN